MNSIEKAAIKLSKTAQVNKVLNKVSGEVTASTVLSQCERMNCDELRASFTFSGGVKPFYVVSVYTKDMDKAFYLEVHYPHIKSKPLAEIYQDLIKIQEGEMK